jgi:tRNA nucleotidyltransferase (CCA-adding enzyme)
MNEEKSRKAISKVLAKAEQGVTPSQKEVKKLSSIAEMIKQRVEEAFEKSHVKPKVRLGGSYAKGTWLPGSADIDFFLMYPVDYARDKLEEEAIEASKKSVKGYPINMRFAEHPYVEAFVEGARVNLVPCYNVERGMWRSAADRSPYHTEYILKFFDDNLKLQTRLLKKFAKNAGVYGAEVKTQGFSGYVCEVLTLGLGSFEAVVSRLSGLKRGEVFSLEPYDQDVVRSFTSSVIILDPVDSTRNLGAAISTQNVSRFILQCRRFLARPSLDFFVAEKKNLKELEARRKNPSSDLLQRSLVITFKTKQRSVDILWGQLYKSLDALSNKIESWGFTILRKKASSNEEDESAFLFLFLETRISEYLQRIGPEVFRGDDFARYMEKNRNKAKLSWLDSDGRVESLFEKEKDSYDIFKVLKKVLGDDKQLETLGLSKAVRDEIRKFKIQSGAEVKGNWLKKDVISLVSGEEFLDAET